jgi:cell division protein FtsN
MNIVANIVAIVFAVIVLMYLIYYHYKAKNQANITTQNSNPVQINASVPVNNDMKSSEIIFNQPKQPVVESPKGEVNRIQDVLEAQRAFLAEREAKAKKTENK